MWRWLKRWGSRFVAGAVALFLALIAARRLWRAARKAFRAKDAVFEAEENEIHEDMDAANQHRQTAHEVMHEAAAERKAAQKRIDEIDEVTRHGDKDLDAAWDDWRSDRADRLRD